MVVTLDRPANGLEDGLREHRCSALPVGWYLSFVLPPVSNSVSRARGLVSLALNDFVPEETIYNLTLLTSEAITNSVKMADESTKILFRFRYHTRRRGRFILDCHDTNGQRDLWIPTNFLYRNTLSQLTKYTDSHLGLGLGLVLMRTIVKKSHGKLIIRRTGDGWNMLRAIFPVEILNPYCPFCIARVH